MVGMLATKEMLAKAGAPAREETPATEETLAKAGKHATAGASNRDTIYSSDAYKHYSRDDNCRRDNCNSRDTRQHMAQQQKVI
jgi:hypothetical protein